MDTKSTGFYGNLAGARLVRRHLTYHGGVPYRSGTQALTYTWMDVLKVVTRMVRGLARV